MFVQSERSVEVHGGQRSDIAVCGHESNDTTWRTARAEGRDRYILVICL